MLKALVMKDPLCLNNKDIIDNVHALCLLVVVVV